MWFGAENGWGFATFILVAALAFYVQRIDQRVRLIKMQQHRLSLTFLNIENELSAIQDSVYILGTAHGGETEEMIKGIRARRRKIFRHTVESLPNVAHILRGLEFPDFDEDPAFWNGDLAKRLGLVDPEDSETSEP
ncbi:hypothetical protein [Tabrizicola sp.]|uniref:hypothetical protein n=1 Tax=Tabrizicola sp. TaxID=2005166 RepID=UPI001A435271|nr:hypothetical protein [Tabrizicola sp.]MBL9072088.1 hypothetical protein [Tabrizicola sp.]